METSFQRIKDISKLSILFWAFINISEKNGSVDCWNVWVKCLDWAWSNCRDQELMHNRILSKLILGNLDKMTLQCTWWWIRYLVNETSESFPIRHDLKDLCIMFVQKSCNFSSLSKLSSKLWHIEECRCSVCYVSSTWIFCWTVHVWLYQL